MKNRDKNADRHKTRQHILSPIAPSGGKDWLGHGVNTGVARVAQLLVDGATMEQMLLTGRNTEASVRACFASFKRDYGLPYIRDEEGLYKFDRDALKAG